MPVIASATASGDFEKAPVGTQQAVCVFVNDIGLQRSVYQGKELVKHQVIITWESSEKMTTGEYAGKPFMLSKYYTLSLNEKANLRKDLEAWRGRQFSEEELKAFDLENLIGANCLLNVVATENDKRKIASIMPLPKGMPKISPTMTEPTDKFREWISKERAKAVVENHTTDVAVSTTQDDTPF